MWLAVLGRLVTKERMRKLHMRVDDPFCCLCDTQTMEASSCLFDKCTYVTTLREELLLWTNTHINAGNMNQMLISIRMKHRKKIKKQVMAAICGAIVYHTWRSRNWNIFRQRIIKKDVISLIKEETIHRIELLKKLKKANRSRDLYIEYFAFRFKVCTNILTS